MHVGTLKEKWIDFRKAWWRHRLLSESSSKIAQIFVWPLSQVFGSCGRIITVMKRMGQSVKLPLEVPPDGWCFWVCNFLLFHSSDSFIHLWAWVFTGLCNILWAPPGWNKLFPCKVEVGEHDTSTRPSLWFSGGLWMPVDVFYKFSGAPQDSCELLWTEVRACAKVISL